MSLASGLFQREVFERGGPNERDACAARTGCGGGGAAGAGRGGGVVRVWRRTGRELLEDFVIRVLFVKGGKSPQLILSLSLALLPRFSGG